MLNLERLGHLTTELSTSLVKSLVLPPGILRRRRPAGATRPETRLEENGRPYLPAGYVILAAGIPVPDDVVVAVIRSAGNRNVQVAVIAGGDAAGAVRFDAAVSPFKRYGMSRIEAVPVADPEGAEDAGVAAQLATADVVLLYGDDPRHARRLLAGTACGLALSAALRAGKVVVAAGGVAAALADRMVLPGAGDSVVIEAGLGLLPGLALPAGLDGRGGHQRLMHVIGTRLEGHFLGLEMSAGSGVIIGGNEARVVGHSVSFLDARDVTRLCEEQAPGAGPTAAQPDEEAVCGLKVHVLVEGYGLNLRTRRPLGPVREGSLQAAGE